MSTGSRIKKASVAQLVERFVEIGVAQDWALLGNEISKVNQLFREKREIVDELKSRPGDQRRVLLDLYAHSSLQVRLNAAKATLAIAPIAARQLLESLTENKLYAQAGDAGMCLWRSIKVFSSRLNP